MKMNLVTGVDDNGAEALRAEEQSVDGNLQTFAGNFDVQVNLSVATGEQLAGFVGDVHFRQKGARDRIDGFCGAHNLALKLAAGKLREFKTGTGARANGRRGAFRNIH